jgi:hypothetical protein
LKEEAQAVKRLIIATLLVGLVAGLFSATAAAEEFPHTRCDPSGDSCISVRKIDGVRRLRIGMLFRYVPRHEVCVRKVEPRRGERTCHTYRARRLPSGLFGSSVDWRAHYPFEGRGVYRASWWADGHPWGALKFRVGGGAR